MGNVQKLLCEMQVDFICASKNTRTNASRGRITRNHSSARTLKPKVYYACSHPGRAQYNLQI